ncbi:LAMI_0A05446g1_1 [Lachancea mirantina]|uniref:LAMI_0A05446g1_1 n=1 Tax=Lachancea mirantina TaxID=1230905 RepID=A0A1G4IQB2_9SACH|nr:LAMI_0A05446g1_1 [Lachancea mirantina]
MKIVVLSGGTAANAILPALELLADELSFVLPISDNGGSTSEILRVVGGPAIGDVRSRIVSLVQDEKLRSLLGYRLPEDQVSAKQEWNLIVEGTHEIWRGFASEVKEICRSFLVHIQAELLKKQKSSAPFQFEKASVGNLFLTGARLFLGSLDAAIELMLRVCRCDERMSVIPCINTNHTHHISALLANGEVITGQSQISHPAKRNGNRGAERDASSSPRSGQNSLLGPDAVVQLSASALGADHDTEDNEEEFAYPGYIHPALKLSQLHFDKVELADNPLLPAAVQRIFYINPYGEEVLPLGSSRAIPKLKHCDLVLFSIGSLMTSLLPITILGNIAESIFENRGARKVLLVNNKYDRETSGLDGAHFVHMIVDSMHRAICNHSQRRRGSPASPSSRDGSELAWSDFVTDVVYLKYGEIHVDTKLLNARGIRTHAIASEKFENDKLYEILHRLTSGEASDCLHTDGDKL